MLVTKQVASSSPSTVSDIYINWESTSRFVCDIRTVCDPKICLYKKNMYKSYPMFIEPTITGSLQGSLGICGLMKKCLKK